jgi:hypothetical protein
VLEEAIEVAAREPLLDFEVAEQKELNAVC